MNIKHVLDCRYEVFLILRRTERHMILNVHNFYVQYPLFSSYFNETGIFQTHLRIIFKYQISLNSVQW